MEQTGDFRVVPGQQSPEYSKQNQVTNAAASAPSQQTTRGAGIQAERPMATPVQHKESDVNGLLAQARRKINEFRGLGEIPYGNIDQVTLLKRMSNRKWGYLEGENWTPREQVRALGWDPDTAPSEVYLTVGTINDQMIKQGLAQEVVRKDPKPNDPPLYGFPNPDAVRAAINQRPTRQAK